MPVAEPPAGHPRSAAADAARLGFIALTLLALLAVPFWSGRRTAAARQQIVEAVEPARAHAGALQRELARQVAHSRGYLLTRDTAYLRRYQEARAAERQAAAALRPLTPRLGADVALALHELESHAAGWQAPTDQAAAGGAGAEQLPPRLAAQQQRYEAAMQAGARLERAIAAVAERHRQSIRRMEAVGRWSTLVLVLLAGAALAVLAHAAARLRRLAQQLRRERREAEAHAAESGRLASELQEQASELQQQVAESEALTEALEGRHQELLQAQQQTEQERHRIAEILDSVADVTFVTDAEWRLTFANWTLEQLTHRSRERIIGAPLWQLLPDLAERRIGAEFRHAMQQRVPVALEEYSPALGRWFEARAHPMQDGGLVGYLGDISDRKALEQRIRQSELLLRSVLESLPVGVCVGDASGTVVLRNAAAERIWAGGAASGLSIPEFADYLAWRADTGEVVLPESWAYSRALREGTHTLGEELEIQAFDGRRKRILNSALPVRSDEGELLGVIALNEDITERRQGEERQKVLVDAARALSRSLEPVVTLEELTALLVPRLADSCLIFLMGDDGRMHQSASRDADPARLPLLSRLAQHYPPGSRNVTTPAARALAAAEVFYLERVPEGFLEENTADEEHHRLLAALAPHSVVAAPLVARGRRLGVLAVSRREGRATFSPADARFFRELAARAALSIDNARLYRAAQDAAERTAELQRLTAALARALTPQDVAAVVVDEAVEALHGDAAFVALRGEQDEVEIFRATGYPDAVLAPHQRFPLDAPLPAAEVIRSGEPLWLESRTDFLARFPSLAPLQGQTGTQALAVLPLEDERGPIGALGLSFQHPRPFPPEERPLLLTFARLCSQALLRTRLFQAERQQRERAEAALTMRDEVLAIVSHDLRNPVHTIQLTADILQEVPLPGEQQARQIAIIRRAAGRMNVLIRDLLDVTRMEAGRFSVEHYPVSIEELLRETVELFRPQAEQNAQQLAWAGDGALPTVSGDRDRLLQLLSNLVGNALKFTPEGGRIRIDARQHAAELHVAVADTGPGIAPEDVPRLFDRFWQAKKNNRGGAGLGLAIARGIVEAHQGRIWAESELGLGTTLHFALPALGPSDTA